MREFLLPLGLAFFAASSLAAAPQEAPFEASAMRFADGPACSAHLAQLVMDARRRNFAAVEGPYEISAGDVRAHMVLAEQDGHRITEHRCVEKQLSSRTWRHSMGTGEAAQPETIESMAAKAEWLKKDPQP